MAEMNRGLDKGERHMIAGGRGLDKGERHVLRVGGAWKNGAGHVIAGGRVHPVQALILPGLRES